ncbi:MAG: glycosyltransferase [Candidatus Peregrinibacteria bacterium]
MPLLSILILNYYKAPAVVAGIQSLLQQECSFEYEILVHDNSVNAQNAEYLRDFLTPLVKGNKGVNPSLLLTIGNQNVGYTKAYNAMGKNAKGKYLAIVNPDIEWKDPKSLQKIIDFLEENPAVGITGPRQKNPDGSIAMTVRKFPHFFLQVARRTWLRNIPFLKNAVAEDEYEHFDTTKTQEVDWIQSSCIFLKKSLWENLGGFDETFFLFLSDTALCKKCWEKKKRVVFFAETEVMADGKRCSEGGFLDFFRKKSIRIHVRDSLKYAWKYR